MAARIPLIAGSLLGALAVALGAFGAHWLRSAVTNWGLDSAEQTRRIEVWEVAVRYQMYHALALLLVGVLAQKAANPTACTIATWLFVVGVLIFSGCLYGLVLSGVKVLGAIVPIGGAAMIAGWLTLLWGVLRER